MRKSLLKFLSIITLSILTSCTISAPIIREIDWDITIFKDLKSGLIYETLSIFLNCYDEDGPDDIETIFFINDEDGIYWELTKDQWDEKFINDTKWIGSSSLVMPNRSNINRNVIRAHVRDKSGETVEDKLYITKRELEKDELTFPNLVINKDIYSIDNYDSCLAYIYSQGKLILTGVIDKTPKSFNSIFGQNIDDLGSDIEIFVIVRKGDQTLKSGPWY